LRMTRFAVVRCGTLGAWRPMGAWLLWMLLVTPALANQCKKIDKHNKDLIHEYETCGECLKETGDSCGWCPDVKGKSVVGCVPVSQKAACIGTFEEGQKSVKTDTPQILNKESKAGISPKKITVKARPNVKVDVKFKARKNAVPVEIYFLMDQSKSMEGERDTLSKLSKKIGKKIKELAPEGYQLGFGAFFEKPIPPFSQRLTDREYDFVHYLSMTKDLNAFEKKVRDSPVQGNHDTPEAGLDALMQVILCQDEIGWTDGRTHIILLLTDAPYHFAGDGILAGIWKPYDTTKCSLERKDNKWVYNSLKHDYPSLSEVNYFLTKKKKNLIFGTADVVTKLYKDLGGNSAQGIDPVITSTAGDMGDGNIGSEDTMLRLITDEYEKIKDSIKIKAEADDDSISIDVSSICDQQKKEKNSFTCEGIKVKQIVDFTAHIELKPEICENPNAKHSLTVEVFGQPDSILTIEIEPNCKCDCDKSRAESDPNGRCNKDNSNGIKCGACDCKDNFSGEFCQCEKGTAGEDQSECMDEDNRECGGRGNCECGECKCNPGYSGKYCQCELKTCQNKYKECYGHGHCQCEGVSTEAKCKCNSGWEGDTCACETYAQNGTANQEKCRDPFSTKNEVCNGEQSNGGTCKCFEDGRRCVCSAIPAAPTGYKGDFCQKHPTNADKDACKKAEKCVLYKIFGKDVGESQKAAWLADCKANKLLDMLRCKKIYTDPNKQTPKINNNTLPLDVEEEDIDFDDEGKEIPKDIKKEDKDLYENDCDTYEGEIPNHHSPCSAKFAGCSFDYHHDGILDYSYNNKDKPKNIYIRLYEDPTLPPSTKKKWSPIKCSSFSLEYTVGITVGVLLFIGAVLFFAYAILINLRDKWEYERFLALQKGAFDGFDENQKTIFQGADSSLKQRVSRMSFRS